MKREDDKNTSGSTATSFWLDQEAREILDRLEAELGMNRSAVVREALRRMESDPKQARIRKLVGELSRLVSGR